MKRKLEACEIRVRGSRICLEERRRKLSEILRRMKKE
jgi:hypothetical protein